MAPLVPFPAEGAGEEQSVAAVMTSVSLATEEEQSMPFSLSQHNLARSLYCISSRALGFLGRRRHRAAVTAVATSPCPRHPPAHRRCHGAFFVELQDPSSSGCRRDDTREGGC
jgi:hypothetical protein